MVHQHSLRGANRESAIAAAIRALLAPLHAAHSALSPTSPCAPGAVPRGARPTLLFPPAGHVEQFVMEAAAVPGLHSAASCVCAPGRNHWLRVAARRVRWTGRTQQRRLVCSSGRNAEESHGEEGVAQSRRSIVQTGAALALLAALRPTAVLAEADPEEDESVKKLGVGLESWNRVRGDGFALSVPPNYDDVVEYDDSGKSLYGERAKEKTFLARFASPDRKEVLSVVARNSTQLKLSFLQTQDITAFGSLEEAAKLFVPAGSKIVAAATRKPADARVPRTYYLYEFLARDDKRVVMSAAAAGGRVYVFGAMAPNSRWKEVGSKMRSAALNFALR